MPGGCCTGKPAGAMQHSSAMSRWPAQVEVVLSLLRGQGITSLEACRWKTFVERPIETKTVPRLVSYLGSCCSGFVCLHNAGRHSTLGNLATRNYRTGCSVKDLRSAVAQATGGKRPGGVRQAEKEGGATIKIDGPGNCGFARAGRMQDGEMCEMVRWAGWRSGYPLCLAGRSVCGKDWLVVVVDWGPLARRGCQGGRE